MSSRSEGTERLGVVLIGHGAPALDCPPQLVGELMSLEWRQGRADPDRHGWDRRAAELDEQIRSWPRHEGNDPYKRGLEQVAGALKPLLPGALFAIGYNEFCRPSIAQAIERVIEQGATRILVIPSMLTPGGVHSEIDIPRALAAIQQGYPRVRLEYVWPFDLAQVAELLAAHLRRAAQASPASRAGGVG